MNLCPISYEPCGNEKYSLKGLKKLSQKLTMLQDFPYTAEEQRQEAASRADKMSIQGLQPKLSADSMLRRVYSRLLIGEDITF